jgi:SAM-dependent methyltransferase
VPIRHKGTSIAGKSCARGPVRAITEEARRVRARGAVPSTAVAEYALSLSEAEVARYRRMAELARDAESDDWAHAGVVPGATVADIGCGPAAVSVVLAEIVGPDGRVIGVERDPQALAQAGTMVEHAGVGNVDLHAGDAADTGVQAGSVDVAMMRHVLAHNGGREQAVVDHLAGLVRPGGSVYLIDVDLTAGRGLGQDPELVDLQDRYVEFHRTLGNDPSVGLRLAQFLSRAGLEVIQHTGRWDIVPRQPGIRPPSWAARDAMVRAGVASDSDVARWDAAFARMDARPEQPTLFIPLFSAVGRQPPH